MTITLNTKEFDEAVLLWLKEQGFSTDRYSISTRTIAGRTDSGAGTRIEATLDPIIGYKPPANTDGITWEEAYDLTRVVVEKPEFPTLNKPSFTRGNANANE
jgi:hypothetical protein